MQFHWVVDQADVARLKDFLANQGKIPSVAERKKGNRARTKRAVDRSTFWKEMLRARMTSRQRSGPGSRVAAFMDTAPFPLEFEELAALHGQSARCSLIATTLQSHGGIRFHHRIARDMSKNYEKLAADGVWAATRAKLAVLMAPAEASQEREVARHLKDLFDGFGPKQSRNLLQCLGLTRYEIPIDSRVSKWLKRFGFPMKLNARALADDDYYEFVLDGIQELCAASGVDPRVLDAAIFASADDGG